MKELYILFIVAGALLIILIGLFILDKTLIRNKKRQVLEKLKALGNIEKEGNLYFLVMGSCQVQLIFLSLKNNQYLTINSANYMQIDQDRNKKPILIKYDYSTGIYKWLIVVPGFHRVKKAINENEVVFISYKDKFDNFTVIRESEIDHFVMDYNKKEA